MLIHVLIPANFLLFLQHLEEEVLVLRLGLELLLHQLPQLLHSGQFGDGDGDGVAPRHGANLDIHALQIIGVLTGKHIFPISKYKDISSPNTIESFQ